MTIHHNGRWRVIGHRTVNHLGKTAQNPIFAVAVIDRFGPIDPGDHIIVTSLKGRKSEVKVRAWLYSDTFYSQEDQREHYRDVYDFDSLMPHQRIWNPHETAHAPRIRTYDDL